MNWTITGHNGDDFMTADEWGAAFGTASSVLHQGNPFARQPDLAQAHARLKIIADRLYRLLKAHTVSIGIDGVLIAAFETATGLEVGRLDKVNDWPSTE